MTISLITGGSRGLGRNTALSIARQGGDVVITYQSRAEDARTAVAEIEAMGRKAVALQLDTGEVAGFRPSSTAAAALGGTWGRDSFDHLVNNAGQGGYATIAETSEAHFDAMVNMHFKGVFFLTQALLPLIADGGRIVNLSSGLTRFSYPGYAAYAAAKGAVEVLTRYLAKELGSRGIAVNTVAPGAIETDFRRRRSTGQSGGQPHGGRHHGAGPGGRAGRHRAGHRPALVGGQPLGERAADRDLRRAGHLIFPRIAELDSRRPGDDIARADRAPLTTQVVMSDRIERARCLGPWTAEARAPSIPITWKEEPP
jgi:NAD(P)-dependent dehydrogenase (short-subunit alcohol dehydrogenase family)